MNGVIADESSTPTSPSTPTFDTIDIPTSNTTTVVHKPRRRRIRGFCVDSDDGASEYSIEDLPRIEIHDSDCANEDDDELDGDRVKIPRTTTGYLVASLLPQRARNSRDNLSVGSDISVAESTISQVSLYQKFASADTDGDFEAIQQELIIEWKWAIGIVSPPSIHLNFLYLTLLVQMLGVTALLSAFYASTGTIISTWMRVWIAISSCSGSIGVVIGTWLVLRYGFSEPAQFRVSSTSPRFYSTPGS